LFKGVGEAAGVESKFCANLVHGCGCRLYTFLVRSIDSGSVFGRLRTETGYCTGESAGLVGWLLLSALLLTLAFYVAPQ